MAGRPPPRHNWVQAEEILLISVLKSMVESRLWTTGSGHFRPGYLRYLKRIIDSDFPDAAIEEWHIEAKIKKWRRTCFIIVNLLDHPGLPNKLGRQEMFNFHCLMIGVFASSPLPRSPRSRSRWRINK
ncbi:hypothetical protein RHMOL_Rhmol02G0254100 [Rhododendron molle]|uniref:Uncharacterized protein n=2 Tax=Rhododendron molle TaxID=49168 RepID=A0ACC0PTT9_RHOML|nr:hypothetical protein RHMOL_Rhmol02G0254100 [Rhododendron molle]